MAKINKKEIIERFGQPDYESATGAMWYFKQMLHIKSYKTKTYEIKFLRFKKGRFEYFDNEDQMWKLSHMQNRPYDAYMKFIEKQVETILLDN